MTYYGVGDASWVPGKINSEDYLKVLHDYVLASHDWFDMDPETLGSVLTPNGRGYHSGQKKFCGMAIFKKTLMWDYEIRYKLGSLGGW